MNTNKFLNIIKNELIDILNTNNNINYDNFIHYFDKEKRIFISAAGRSSMAARGFVNRLVHLGFNAHLVGEISSPKARENDLLIIISNSGNTSTLNAIAQRAHKDDVKILSITSNKDSPIYAISDYSIIIEGSNKTNQPMGTLFEQFVLLLVDSIILYLMDINSEDSDSMRIRHSNLE